MGTELGRTATGSDPDDEGLTINYTWLVEGNQVATGNSYPVTPQR